MPLRYGLGSTGSGLPILLFILYMVGGGMLTAWLAGQKGRDKGEWFLLGAIFNILALVAVGLAPPVKPASSESPPEDLESDAQPWNPGSGPPPSQE